MQRFEGGPLGQHASLCIAWIFIIVVEFSAAWSRYHRNWCGMRLVFPILLQAFWPIAAVTLIYIDLFHVSSAVISPRYFILLSFVAASLAHFAYRFVTHLPSLQDVGPAAAFSVIPLRIAQKRMLMASDLKCAANCKDVLFNALELSLDLPAAKKASLKRQVSRSGCTEHLIFEIIDAVGITMMKVVLKGVHLEQRKQEI